jgi:hypothetical protein
VDPQFHCAHFAAASGKNEFLLHNLVVSAHAQLFPTAGAKRFRQTAMLLFAQYLVIWSLLPLAYSHEHTTHS